MNLPAVSIVIRSKNDAQFMGQTLDAVRSQDYPEKVRRIHIDSGSTDGTCETIRKSDPDVFVQIRPEEYVPGKVLNMGMNLSAEGWVVFLNSDATPVGRDWLAHLLAPAASGRTAGAVFGRQIPRPDCWAVYAHDYERCFGPERESRHWKHFFSMANSAVSRAAWKQHAFREDLMYAEDHEWSFRLKEAGWRIEYAEDAVAMHSHNYTPSEARRRLYGDTIATALTGEAQPADYGFVRSVVVAAARDSIKDFIYCARHGRLSEWPMAVAVRYAQRKGKREGFLAGHRRFKGEAAGRSR